MHVDVFSVESGRHDKSVKNPGAGRLGHVLHVRRGHHFLKGSRDPPCTSLRARA